MDFVYNHDGSIKFCKLASFIQVGSSYTEDIFVSVEGYNTDQFTIKAIFVLPNGDVNELATTGTVSKTFDGTTYNGRTLWLTSAQTLYAGNVKMTLQVLGLNQEVLFTYKAIITINKSATPPDTTNVSSEQYTNLLNSMNSYQLKYNNRTLRVYNSLASAEADKTNLANEQVVFIYSTTSVSAYYYDSANNQLLPLAIDIGGVQWGSILGNLASQTDLQTALNGKQATLTAGTGITITNNVISSADISWEEIE